MWGPGVLLLECRLLFSVRGKTVPQHPTGKLKRGPSSEESICCSCRRLVFSSQHPCLVAHNSKSRFRASEALFWPPWALSHMWHTLKTNLPKRKKTVSVLYLQSNPHRRDALLSLDSTEGSSSFIRELKPSSFNIYILIS